MPSLQPFPLFDNYAHLKTFPDHVLLDIARNGAAKMDYRLLAVEILQARKSPKVTHPDLRELVQELEIELDGIVFEHPAPGPGPLTASVTTKTMVADETVNNGFTGFDEVETVSPEVAPIDVPTTEPEPVPAKPTKSRKPKEPVDAPQS